MSLGDTGAFKACASSWAFALTLPRRPRIVLRASLKLFCCPCLRLGSRELLKSGCDCQRSLAPGTFPEDSRE